MRAILIQTDFGPDHLSASAMTGVCRGVCPELSIYEATHMIRPFDVLNASDALMYNLPFWKETVFVSVVDPGVGTRRRSCAAKLRDGNFIVTPDNGTLTYVKQRWGIEEVREIDQTINRYHSTRDIYVFHGRDVYAYCAARLASGVISFEEVGPAYPVEDIVEAPYPVPEIGPEGFLTGMVIEASEHFGLVNSNIPFSWLAQKGIQYGTPVDVEILHKDRPVFVGTLAVERSFGYVAPHDALVMQSETGTVSLGENLGNFVTRHNLDFGCDWTIRLRKSTGIPATAGGAQ
ncbi:SAM-dependent chlorinase/fluorinase [uncultured Oscillibacter sp.]|uniref:SAM hydrolase/SAM-dependent halogenase family protein n=1 Tax=uncultured Oscillibacter sp. TaxID=876091 RepID=UPI0025D72119|nr:SAM-dependent chlorinase/fluorinase [uncultured Oscillibacter sp.]